MKAKNISNDDLLSLIACLGEESDGREVFRIQDKTNKSIRLEFAIWEEQEAKHWFAENALPNEELARVRVLTRAEKLMLQAGEVLAYYLETRRSIDAIVGQR